MFDFIKQPIAWIAVGIIGLLFWYIVFRLAFRAYYKSRLEYYQNQLRRKKNESDTERDGDKPTG